jgi:tRNA A-37 threonylcarbamoyl transferase component Bud32
MLKIKSHQSLSAEAVAQVARYLGWPPFKRVLWANPYKHRYVFPLEADGRDLIVKIYHHGNLTYRLAALLGLTYADRYYEQAIRLAEAGVPVPTPVMLYKWGPGIFPHQTLFVMERREGRELRELLPEIENNDARIEKIVEEIAGVVAGLRRARVSHRDLNLKNFLLTDFDGLTLIDLDSASHHRSVGRRFLRRHRRDIEGFIKACGAWPRFAAAVARKLQDAA